MVTVGYGDITPVSDDERTFAIFLMVIGVVTFSFVSGTMTNIISSFDNGESFMQEKIAMLNSITTKYSIDTELFGKVLKVLRYDNSRNDSGMRRFLNDLPPSLKHELTIQIQLTSYRSVYFFQGREAAFISWMSPLIVEQEVEGGEYFYQEGAEITNGREISNSLICSLLSRKRKRSFGTTSIQQRSFRRGGGGGAFRALGCGREPRLA